MRWSRGAPTFSAIAAEVEERIADCVFVAHNARFDHGFLKHAFARIGRPFSARPLCTVRLSRRLFPDAHGHGLDAMVARHGLAVTDRHRALGDARALWAFVAGAVSRVAGGSDRGGRQAHPQDPEPAAAVAARQPRPASRHPRRLPLLRRESAADLRRQERQPARTGGIALRGRLAQRKRPAAVAGNPPHRIRGDRRRIRRAAARSRSSSRSLLPAHNRVLRRKEEAGVLALVPGGAPQFVPAAGVEPAELRGSLRTLRVQARRARDAARAGDPTTRCAGNASVSSGAPPGRVSSGS